MSQQTETVLVVDDEDNIRTILRRTLEKKGFNVIEASNGTEALELLKKNEIDVAILDVMMPGLSGLDVLRELSVFRPDVGVIMATAVDDIQTAVDTMKIGAYDYIQKPFNSEAVVEVVRKVARKRELKKWEGKKIKEIQEKLKEQSEQLTSQFKELMANMMREHHLLYQLEKERQSGSKHEPIPGLPMELQKPLSSVNDFKDALLRILQRQQIE